MKSKETELQILYSHEIIQQDFSYKTIILVHAILSTLISLYNSLKNVKKLLPRTYQDARCQIKNLD